MPQEPHYGRRFFLRTAASLGVAVGLKKGEQPRETVYRLRTPECEVRMSVQYFGNSVKSFRFRDRLSDREFCLSADGNEGQNCVEGFSGSVAVAYYHFRALSSLRPPLSLRERVLTIDHDSRMTPRPPFERILSIQRDMASDIQAFGYTRDLFSQERGGTTSSPWCLLRQDLYLNDQTAAFMIVHWKHTIESITLVDVIPGDQTQMFGEGATEAAR